VAVDTFGGRVHVEWDAQAAVTPLGQLPFFTEFLRLGGRFDAWVDSCPLVLTSPNAPSNRDLLGTAVLAVLSGHQRYAHINALRGERINASLLGMEAVVSEDSVRRNVGKLDEADGVAWLQNHLYTCVSPVLGEPWILDADVTVKPLYGHQEGALKGQRPGSQHEARAKGERVDVRRSPQAVACRKRDVRELGKPRRLLDEVTR
jgi:hypothetical protein